jgi:hypothetical protein
MSNDDERQRGLRLLSLGAFSTEPYLLRPANIHSLIAMTDGGGIRGISELVILQEIMHRVQRIQKLDHPPLPSDYFDLICGTSTGG